MKKDRLVVAVLGRTDSGKSTTWNRLFGKPEGQRVHTTWKPRWLEIRPGEWVEVFLITRSPEEAGEPKVYESLRGQSCPIVLCSMRYAESAKKMLDYFIQEGFDLYVQWLNPGYDKQNRGINKKSPIPDRRGLRDRVRAAGGQFFIRNGNTDPTDRVEEIRDHIYEWAKTRNLIA